MAMPPRRKTWADIMSDDESLSDDDFLFAKRQSVDTGANLVLEDTYQGPQHADAEHSRLGLNAALDAMECSVANSAGSKGDDDSGFFTPYSKKKRRQAQDAPTDAPKNPRESPKSKVPRLEGQKTASQKAKEPPPAPARPDFATASKAALAGKGKAKGGKGAKEAKDEKEAKKTPTRAPWAGKSPALEATMRSSDDQATMLEEAVAPEPTTPAGAKPAKVELRSLAEAGPERAAAAAAAAEVNVDWERRSQQRQKQVEIGKATVGYQRYKELHRGGPDPAHPVTPRADSRKDRKDWNLELKVWRTFLHKYDPPEEN